MGHSQADKTQSRERILTEAAEQIREGGLDSVSVGTLMRSVNLTHGGFYGHFASRSELLAEALERALCDGEAASSLAAGSARAPDFAASVRSYLSRKHRDSRRNGCAIAALACDVARADESSRRVVEAHIDRYAGKLAAAMGTPDEGKALFVVSALIGALLVSRVVTGPKRSDAVLMAARQQLLALGGADPAGG